MARPMGSTFDTMLPLAKQMHVAAINWGFVHGKSQTYMPWDSWKRPYVEESRRCGSTMCCIRMGGPIASAKQRFCARKLAEDRPRSNGGVAHSTFVVITGKRLILRLS